jgi:hypothetical protein
VFWSNTLNILKRSHLSSHFLAVLAELKPTPNRTNLAADTIQARLNLDFDVKSATIQFYNNSHNSQSDRWIGLTFYVEYRDMLSYLELKFQVNRSSGRHHDTGQQRRYEFCYLLPFDLWTFYLARILFLKGCGSLF